MSRRTKSNSSKSAPPDNPPRAKKWLKDRKGRKLSKDDIAHYQKMIIALAETIRLMAEIDVVIEQHGGWPDAFKPAEGTAPPAPPPTHATSSPPGPPPHTIS